LVYLGVVTAVTARSARFTARSLPALCYRGYLLLVIFAIAIIVHALHGDYEVAALLVYAAAVFATMHSDAT